MSKFSEYVLYSGGAYGADAIWGVLAHKYGLYRQFHIRPKGNEKIHKSLSALGFNPYVAGEFELQVARDEIRELLGINLTPSLASDLKARNYYQVAKSECVIAVARLDGSGGTNIAIQLGIKLKLPTYVLDVDTERWYNVARRQPSNILGYNGFEPCDTPKLYRKTTLVGTRDIEDYKVLRGDWISRPEFVGKDKADRIKSLMEQVFIKSLEIPEVEKIEEDFIKKLSGLSFTDSEFTKNKRVIEEGIRNVLDSGIFPIQLGGQLNTRAPRTYQYLCKRLHDEFGVRYD